MKIHAFLFALVAFCACQNPTQSPNVQHPINPKKMIAETSAFWQNNNLQTSPQIFKISGKKPSKVKGKKGTILDIEPQNLEFEDGRPVQSEVEILLKELTTSAELAREGAQTRSGDKILVSGGAYLIEARSEGKLLRLKTGKTLKATFPKYTDTEMSLFYGKKDSLGLMDWGQPAQKMTVPSAPKKTNPPTKPRPAKSSEIEDILAYVDEPMQKMTPAELAAFEKEQAFKAQVTEKIYEGANISTMGWINIDAFAKIEESKRTNLKFEYANFSNFQSLPKVMLVFKERNSFLEFYAIRDTFSENNMPIGEKVNLLAYCSKNDTLYGYYQQIVIKANQKIRIELQPITLQMLEKWIKDK